MSTEILSSSFPDNMVARLRVLADERGTDTALIAVSARGDTRIDYATLDLRARALAAGLQTHFSRGDRALLLLDNDEHYVTGFFACLYAGLIAVPLFPPESAREQHLARLAAIAADSQACCGGGDSGSARGLSSWWRARRPATMEPR